ncbi:MAG: benzoyl-CoA reductase subunit D [Polyangiaceae bacterium]|nr:benzoyl-CoA reductase subunit D [Polyangiaceae bacterium]
MTQLLSAGIDLGSSAVKVAVVRSRAGQEVEVLATSVQRIRRRMMHEVASAAFDEACGAAGVTRRQLCYVASTGEGEAPGLTTGHFYGITSHGRGGAVLCPEARAALDIGALHARAIKIDERGKVLGHRMTSQCASGSGQFLENIARYLGVPIEDVGALSLTAQAPEDVSSICAVLAETDVINMVSRGITTADILAGIHESIAGRLAKLLRSVGAEGAVVLTGGLAQNAGIARALESLVSEEKGKFKSLRVVAPPDAQCAGAIGAAALAAQRYTQLSRAGRLGALSQERAG